MRTSPERDHNNMFDGIFLDIDCVVIASMFLGIGTIVISKTMMIIIIITIIVTLCRLLLYFPAVVSSSLKAVLYPFHMYLFPKEALLQLSPRHN